MPSKLWMIFFNTILQKISLKRHGEKDHGRNSGCLLWTKSWKDRERRLLQCLWKKLWDKKRFWSYTHTRTHARTRTHKHVSKPNHSCRRASARRKAASREVHAAGLKAARRIAVSRLARSRMRGTIRVWALYSWGRIRMKRAVRAKVRACTHLCLCVHCVGLWCVYACQPSLRDRFIFPLPSRYASSVRCHQGCSLPS